MGRLPLLGAGGPRARPPTGSRRPAGSVRRSPRAPGTTPGAGGASASWRARVRACRRPVPTCPRSAREV